MILFFDLEFNCDENSLRTNWSDPLLPPEVIEIGMVCYDKGNITGTFETLVQPVVNSSISQYCMNLTGINNEQLKNAGSLVEANFNITAWLKNYPINSYYSWGKEDLLFWQNDSIKQNSLCPLDPNKYIDLMKLAAQKVLQNNNLCERETIRKKLNITGKNLHDHTALSDSLDLISLYEGIVNFKNE